MSQSIIDIAHNRSGVSIFFFFIFLSINVLVCHAQPPTWTPLTCNSTDSTITIIRRACMRDAACRFVVETTVDWHLMLVDDMRLFHPDELTDARRFFEDVTWRTGRPLIVIDNVTVDCGWTGAPTTMDDFVNDPGLPPPDALRRIVDLVIKYQQYISEDSKCNDINQIQVRHPVTGKLFCECLPGKICDTSYIDKVAITIIVMVLVIVLIHAAYTIHQARGIYQSVMWLKRYVYKTTPW